MEQRPTTGKAPPSPGDVVLTTYGVAVIITVYPTTATATTDGDDGDGSFKARLWREPGKSVGSSATAFLRYTSVSFVAKRRGVVFCETERRRMGTGCGGRSLLDGQVGYLVGFKTGRVDSFDCPLDIRTNGWTRGYSFGICLLDVKDTT